MRLVLFSQAADSSSIFKHTIPLWVQCGVNALLSSAPRHLSLYIPPYQSTPSLSCSVYGSGIQSLRRRNSTWVNFGGEIFIGASVWQRYKLLSICWDGVIIWAIFSIGHMAEPWPNGFWVLFVKDRGVPGRRLACISVFVITLNLGLEHLVSVVVSFPLLASHKMSLYLLVLAISLQLVPIYVSADNGMDMSMDGPMALAGASMTPYLHFSHGDTIWFLGWVPQSRGAIGGACVGLFLLGLVDRWLAAIRATADRYWRTRAQVALSNHISAINTSSEAKRTTLSRVVGLRYIPPFIFSHDVSRGILHAAQMALNFAFMLVVMTYQVAFILSIVVGLGVGEMLFGRFISAAHTH